MREFLHIFGLTLSCGVSFIKKLFFKLKTIQKDVMKLETVGIFILFSILWLLSFLSEKSILLRALSTTQISMRWGFDIKTENNFSS